LRASSESLQGAFGALLTPSALAVIVAAFPHEERGAAVGSWTAWAEPHARPNVGPCY
jgi:MFS family permease